MRQLHQNLLLLSAMFASSTQDNLYTVGHKRANRKFESPEDRERRERCEQIAIEKAKAKRERKEKKRMATALK